MKKIIVKIALAALLAMPLAVALPAQAILTPSWDVTGHWVVGFQLGGTYLHDMDLVQDSSGNITGSGGYLAGSPSYSYAWSVISGSVVGNTFTLDMVYTTVNEAQGAVTHMTGTIMADGTMNGNWNDNYLGGYRAGTWSTVSGTANMTGVTGWGTELSASACVGKTGSPVVNITQKVVNDVDSGLAGNWAIDNYNRHVQVWRTGSKTSNTYCALVTYEGTADAVAGKTGPGGSGTIGDGVSAEMKGGYRATFTGTFNPTGQWQIKGSVGTVNYGCDISGSTCTYVSWVDKYFTGVTGFDQPWWGWFYYAGDHGSWLNSIDGNFGNIY